MRRSIAGIVALICGSIAFTAPAAGLVVDDFEVGAFSLQGLQSDGNVTDNQSGLDTTHVLSGERRVILNTDSTTTPATASLVLTSGDDAVDFVGPTPSSGLLSSGLTLRYLFTNFDITQGGTLDRFVVDIPAVSGQGTVNVFVDSGPALIGGPVTTVTAPGSFTFLFSDYNPVIVDLTQLDEIRVTLGTAQRVSASLSSVVATPEPSTAMLLGLGFAAMAVARRHRSAGCRG